ncbi:uncharacterized protein VTP21DRAFT_10145 [Calcarisporiella thermophila]|uniref:uncharacterized protein n=1 Tax=Calcarisporiella thermophila TaxID=911321 RepID=UPI003742034D
MIKPSQPGRGWRLIQRAVYPSEFQAPARPLPPSRPASPAYGCEAPPLPDCLSTSTGVEFYYGRGLLVCAFSSRLTWWQNYRRKAWEADQPRSVCPANSSKKKSGCPYPRQILGMRPPSSELSRLSNELGVEKASHGGAREDHRYGSRARAICQKKETTVT